MLDYITSGTRNTISGRSIFSLSLSQTIATLRHFSKQTANACAAMGKGKRRNCGNEKKTHDRVNIAVKERTEMDE